MAGARDLKAADTRSVPDAETLPPRAPEEAPAGKVVLSWEDSAPPHPARLLGPSPNPATNLAIADIALRSATILVRQGVERALLGSAYTPRKASSILSGRTMAQVLFHRSIARVAMGSVPGALAVGGTLLVKTLYERRQARRAAAAGTRSLERMAQNGSKGTKAQ